MIDMGEPDGGAETKQPRGIPLPGGKVATTLEEACASSMSQLYATRRGRVADAEKERDWMIWVTGAEAGMRLIYEMGRELPPEESSAAMRTLYHELQKLVTQKNNLIVARVQVARDRMRRQGGERN